MTLEQFFSGHPTAAIAFSGGVDSAFLLSAACRYGGRIKAYYVRSPFQPRFELEDAAAMADFLGADLQIISVDVLADSVIVSNPSDRCYHCKKMIFSKIADAAAKDGFSLLLDGTNASDDGADRPGMRALKELSVRSPLRECGLTKARIRQLSKEAGLFTWDKPAYACLATRIPTGVLITAENLRRTEQAEAFLFQLGLRDFRVRTWNGAARIQVRQADLERVIRLRPVITAELKKYYSAVLLDLEVRNEQ